jgi:hypothetical protein
VFSVRLLVLLSFLFSLFDRAVTMTDIVDTTTLVLTHERATDKTLCARLYDTSPHNTTLDVISEAWFNTYGQTVSAHTVRDWVKLLKGGKDMGRPPAGGRPHKIDDGTYLETEEKLHKAAKKVISLVPLHPCTMLSHALQDTRTPPKLVKLALQEAQDKTSASRNEPSTELSKSTYYATLGNVLVFVFAPTHLRTCLAGDYLHRGHNLGSRN